MGKDRNFYPFSPRSVIHDCSSTAYSEPPTDTHKAVICTVCSELVKECGLTDESRVLEIGAGHGQFLASLRGLLLSTKKGIAVNVIHEDYLECLSNGFISVKSEMHDLIESKYTWFYDADLVVMRHILEHSPFPFFILRNLCGILKEGSYIYVEVPAPDSWANHESNPNHYSVMGANMWRSLFLKAGLTIKRDWNIQVPIPQPSGDILTDTYFGFILEVRWI